MVCTREHRNLLFQEEWASFTFCANNFENNPQNVAKNDELRTYEAASCRRPCGWSWRLPVSKKYCNFTKLHVPLYRVENVLAEASCSGSWFGGCHAEPWSRPDVSDVSAGAAAPGEFKFCCCNACSAEEV